MARIGKNQLIQLQKKYNTDEAIARLYGMTRQGIHRLRKKYGISHVAEKQKERNQNIITSHKEGMAVIALSKKYNLSITQTYRIVKSNLTYQ